MINLYSQHRVTMTLLFHVQMRMLVNELKSKNCWIFMYIFFVFSELFILNFLLHSSSLRCKGY